MTTSVVFDNPVLAEFFAPLVTVASWVVGILGGLIFGLVVLLLIVILVCLVVFAVVMAVCSIADAVSSWKFKRKLKALRRGAELKASQQKGP